MTKFYMGTGIKITDGQMYGLVRAHRIDEARLRAVLQVEARNSGFYSSGALRCLYEPHIAWKYTKGDVRKKLVAAGLAYRSWGTKKYPKSSFSRIDKCAAIAGEEVAALSTSWGMPQIVGFNHKAAGFPTAVAMVKSFALSEANQIGGMINFIKANKGMLAALNAAVPGDKESWRPFARPYNGPSYAKHNYHGRLANAHKKWDKRLSDHKKWENGLAAAGQLTTSTDNVAVGMIMTPMPAYAAQSVVPPPPDIVPLPPVKPQGSWLANLIAAMLNALKGLRP